MISDLDLTGDVQWADTGVPPGGDKESLVTGIVTAVNAATNRVSVSFKGGAPRPMVALPGYYTPGQTVFLLRNPITARTVLCLGPTLGYPAVVLATVTVINTTTVRMTVTMLDGSSATVPYIAGTYTVGAQVWVQLDPSTFGGPYLVLGPAALPPAAAVQPPPAVVPVAASTVTASVTIFPEWSGSWRSSVSAYGRWNVNTYGYDVLYQGDGYGSGPMTGLATYGNRVTDLGALSIQSGTVTLRGAGISAASYPTITVQCSSNASQPAGAPSTTGTDTATGDPGRSGVVQTALTANMLEALRTGTARGLVTNGPGYGAVRGTGAADGMAITLNYTKAA